jgi:glycosyltransferase involved in cell wall biosynthesis
MSDRSPSIDISIVMPAYNLEEQIAANIDRTVLATSELGPVEIVVVDDGSADGTLVAAREAASRYNEVRIVSHSPNRGKGAALQAGFGASSGTEVVFLDGDLDLPPEQVPGFVQQFRLADVDALVGAKQTSMEPGSYPLMRRILSRLFSLAIRLMFRLPVRETQTGLKVFRREALETVMPRLRLMRYTYDLELVVSLHRGGYRIEEAPVELSVGASAGGVTLRTLWEMGRDTLRIWLRSIFRRY